MSEMSEETGPPEYAERVMEVAERIPPGRVMTYGDVAEWLAGEAEHAGAPDGPEGAEGTATGRPGGGPRQVGRAMALYGGAVPWWRVVRADGVLLPGSEHRALARYREEGTPLTQGRSLRATEAACAERIPRIDMRRARWDGTEAPSPSAPSGRRRGGVREAPVTGASEAPAAEE